MSLICKRKRKLILQKKHGQVILQIFCYLFLFDNLYYSLYFIEQHPLLQYIIKKIHVFNSEGIIILTFLVIFPNGFVLQRLSQQIV